MFRIALLSLCMLIFLPSCDTLDEILATQGGAPGGGITNAEAALGLKDALSQGAVNGANVVSQVNGYFGNPAIKIPFPPEAQKIENTLRTLGMNKLADDVILTVNRAAEDAAKEAGAVFVNAIKQMTIGDAMNILFGPEDAATQYLQRTTTNQLTTKFKPIINSSLGKTNATKYWTQAINTYNDLPTTLNKLNPDLTAFVTEKALDGLFKEVAKEEKRIRENPIKRGTEMMQKVFGYYDANK